jgi:hypothetical protein
MRVVVELTGLSLLLNLLRPALRLILLVVIPIVSLFVGYRVGYQLSGAGRLPATPRQVVWQPLGSPPKRPVAILAVDVSSVAAVSATGTIYRWQFNTGWQPVEQLPVSGRSSPAFDLPHEPPPGEVLDLAQVVAPGEAGTYTEFALLADGSVWMWQYTQPGIGLLVGLVYGVVGSGVGLGVGVVLMWWVGRKTRPAISARRGKGTSELC